jgi:fluoroacetyl-CoA thioesterase
MKDSLTPGLTFTHRYCVPEDKTVPALYRESEIMQGMPPVFATAFMIGLMEWACVELMKPHLEDGEGSVGVHVDVSHSAATPVGMTVTVEAELVERDGRRLKFAVVARDEAEEIGRGIHERVVVHWNRFVGRHEAKVAAWKGDGG